MKTSISKERFEELVSVLEADGWVAENASGVWTVFDPEGNPVAGGTSRFAAWIVATDGFSSFED